LRGEIDLWKVFRAGLPAVRKYRATQEATLPQIVLKILATTSSRESEHPYHDIELPSEGGAGSTTLMRATAHQCASAGYPVLVLRPDQVDIDADHVLAFSTSLANASAKVGVTDMPAMLIVLDVEHEQRTRVRELAQVLASHNRRIVFLRAIKEQPSTSTSKTRTRLNVLGTNLQEAKLNPAARHLKT